MVAIPSGANTLHLTESPVSMLVPPDYDTVHKSLRWAFPLPNQIFEVRALTAYRGLASTGYFNDPVLAANAICNADNDGIGGTYVTINPVMPEAFARCSNHMVTASRGSFTSDREILERRGMLLDFDPVRLSGISSTDEEHEQAIQYMLEITERLTLLHGFPNPCLVDSGNGGHARYMLEALPNNQDTTDLIKATLGVLDTKFSNARVTIDKTVFNAARIQRVIGTAARKGEHTPERPHRRSRLLRDFDPMDVLHADTIRRMVSYYGVPQAPERPRTASKYRGEYPPDEAMYRSLNVAARSRKHDWVANLLGHVARPSGDDYRIASRDLGRPLEEDISITDTGIKDFGVADMGDATEGRRTPISLLAEHLYEGDKRKAAEALSLCLNVPLHEFEGKPLPDPVTMPPELMGGDTLPMAKARTFADVMYLPVRPVTFTVRGFIADNTHTVLSAPAKLGKSTLMYAMCLHLLFGRPLWDRPVTTCNVLFCALEETDERFRRKLWEQYYNLEAKWGDVTEEQRVEAFKHFRFFTKDSRNQNGVSGTLPLGYAGAEEIRRIIREDKSRPWFILIEPVNKFHDHSKYSTNLNALEYEQIEIINDIIKASEYTCSIVTIKHDRKSPAGGIRGTANLMDSISGSVAQSGAPDAQIQFLSNGGFDNLEGLNWLIIQSRDFGKEKIPIISDGVSWIKPPPDFEIPDFDDYLNTRPDGRGGSRLKDPRTDEKILGELAKEITGLRPRELEARLNINYQTILRRLKYMNNLGMVYEDRRNQRDVLYMVTGPATLPGTLQDVL